MSGALNGRIKILSTRICSDFINASLRALMTLLPRARPSKHEFTTGNSPRSGLAARESSLIVHPARWTRRTFRSTVCLEFDELGVSRRGKRRNDSRYRENLQKRAQCTRNAVGLSFHDVRYAALYSLTFRWYYVTSLCKDSASSQWKVFHPPCRLDYVPPREGCNGRFAFAVTLPRVGGSGKSEKDRGTCCICIVFASNRKARSVVCRRRGLPFCWRVDESRDARIERRIPCDLSSRRWRGMFVVPIRK